MATEENRTGGFRERYHRLKRDISQSRYKKSEHFIALNGKLESPYGRT